MRSEVDAAPGSRTVAAAGGGPGEGTSLRSGRSQVTLKLTSRESGRFSLAEHRAEPHFVAPPILHHHTIEDWAAYVVEGEITFAFAEREVRASAGTTVFVPAGTDFSWRNERDEPARYIAVYAPAGFEQFFTDMAQALAARGSAPPPEAMREIIPPLWAKYHVQPRAGTGGAQRG